MAKKENTFEEICRDIVAKKFQPVYILMGEEPFFMDRITDLLIENVLAESERDFNQMIMYGADTDAAMIINAARRFPMMSEYQLVVVREAQLVRDIGGCRRSFETAGGGVIRITGTGAEVLTSYP